MWATSLCKCGNRYCQIKADQNMTCDRWLILLVNVFPLLRDFLHPSLPRACLPGPILTWVSGVGESPEPHASMLDLCWPVSPHDTWDPAWGCGGAWDLGNPWCSMLAPVQHGSHYRGMGLWKFPSSCSAPCQPALRSMLTHTSTWSMGCSDHSMETWGCAGPRKFPAPQAFMLGPMWAFPICWYAPWVSWGLSL